MGIGSVIGNFLVGGIIDLFMNIFTKNLGAERGMILGMQAGYAFIGICSLLSCAASIILYFYLKKKRQLI
jgi:hypothetical protein